MASGLRLYPNGVQVYSRLSRTRVSLLLLDKLDVNGFLEHLQILMQYAHEYRAQRANGHQHTNEDQTQHANGVQANDDSQISITDDANEHRTKGTKDSPLSISDESD